MIAWNNVQLADIKLTQKIGGGSKIGTEINVFPIFSSLEQCLTSSIAETSKNFSGPN